MIPKPTTRYGLLLLWIGLTSFSTSAQTNNLLQNPNADEGARFWRIYGDAKVEQTSDGNWRFAVRSKGSFLQKVTLPDDSVGKYALLIGRASSERVNSDGAITGLPYLYGYMMERADQRVPQNGSAAWFDDLGLYLFSTEEEGKAFVQAYNEQNH